MNSRRRQGRLSVQSRPPKETRIITRIAMVPFLIVSIFFSIMGFTQLMPVAGLFGVVWTLVSLSFAVLAVVMMVRKTGLPQSIHYDLEQGEGEFPSQLFQAHSTDDAPGGGAAPRLEQLRTLYESRLITAEEYDQKRKEILKEL